MNRKLSRKDYYNEDYALNPQEEKEFQLSLKDPYHKTRSRAYLLDLDIFGDKDNLQRQVELFLFNTPEKHLPPKQDCKKLFSTDLFEKRFGLSDAFSSIDPSPLLAPIYSSFPEIKQMRKDLSYEEIYCALSTVADPQMLFINMFKDKPENNLINGLLYFPFTPEDIEHADEEVVIALANEFSLKANYICSESDRIKILRQKLLDMFYLCDDLVDLHGVTDCHSKLTLCPNISSFYCENHMCKKCCEMATDKKFCPIHDDIVNFYRGKMRELFEFEMNMNQFDRTRTVRLSIRKRITKSELRKMFEEDGYSIDWDGMTFKFNESVQKLQYVYLTCTSNEEAKKIYDDRTKIIKKFEKFDITLQSLMEDIKNVIDSVSNILTSCIVVVPISNIVKNYKKIPQKAERNKKFAELIEKTLGINDTQYTLSNCHNMINSELLSYDYFVVTFTSKELLDKFYYLQPYFEAVIVHKLSHLKFFPFLRNKSIKWRNLCINCNKEKNHQCYFDLCSDCCNKQKNYIKDIITSKLGLCPCSKDITDIDMTSQDKCEICKVNEINDKCVNKLCDECCRIQIIPEKLCYIHHNKYSSKYFDMMKGFKLNSNGLIQRYHMRKSTIKMRIMNYLRNGDFSWFRPIADTNVTRLMLDMNKELMIIMDNPNYKRDNPLKINDKMYKVYTYQNEQQIIKQYDNCLTEETFDEKGDFFIEYDFTMGRSQSAEPKVFIEAQSEKLESIDIKNLEKDYGAQSELTKSAITKTNFHLCFYGLDNERYTTFELIDEIYHELKSYFNRVSKEDIQILDEVSVMNMLIGKNGEFFTEYDKFEEFGRFALIRMKNEKDALKILLEKTRLVIPLKGGKKGEPQMIIGEALRKYIEQN